MPANADATLTIDVEARKAIAELQQLAAGGKRVDDQFDKTEKSTKRLATGFGSLKRQVAGLAAGFSAGLLGRAVIQNTIASQNAIAQLGAVLESTGGIAGQTMESLEAMGSALQQTTVYGDEAVHSAQALLLTFKKIRGDAFEPALRVTMDLATAMGTDLRSAALQVGKALEDPSTQMSQLRRSGVSFTQEQIELAKRLQETGDMAGAQAIVLRELEAQFGGSAEAARNTLGGALEYVKNQFSDALEISTSGSQGMVDALNSLGAAIPKVRGAIDKMVVSVQVWAAQMAVTQAQVDLLKAKLKFWDKEGIRQAEDALERMLVAMNNVIVPLEQGTDATQAVTTATAGLTTVVEDQAEAAKRAAEEWEKFLKVLKQVQEQQERFGAGVYARQAMSPVGGGIPSLGGGPVTANLSVAAGQQLYRDYEQYMARVMDEMGSDFENLGQQAGTVIQGLTSVADAFIDLDAEARQALQGVSSLIQGLSVGGLAGGIGIAGGVAGLVGAFLNFGRRDTARPTSSVDQSLVRAAEQQQRASERFEDSVKRFAEAVGGTPGSLADELAAITELWKEVGDPANIDWETWEKNLQTYSERLGQITEQYREEIEIRRLTALGMTDEAEALRISLSNRRELDAAIKAGWDEATISQLRYVQALEAAIATKRDEQEAIRTLIGAVEDGAARITYGTIHLVSPEEQAQIDKLRRIDEEERARKEAEEAAARDIGTPRVSQGRYSDWPVTLSEVTGQSINAIMVSQLSWLRVIASNTGRTAANTSSLSSATAIDSMLGASVSEQERWAGRAIV